MSSGVKTNVFIEYAAIHQKIEIQTGLAAVSERQVGGMIMTRRGLLRKHALLEVISGNMSKLTEWVKAKDRSPEEVQIARSGWLQWKEISDTVKGQIIYIDSYLKGQSNGFISE
jgi:hypothetical protein